VFTTKTGSLARLASSQRPVFDAFLPSLSPLLGSEVGGWSDVAEFIFVDAGGREAFLWDSVRATADRCRRNICPYKAFAEVGKAEKTIFLCDCLASREVQRELTPDRSPQRKKRSNKPGGELMIVGHLPFLGKLVALLRQ
jgi:hypothetical protein